MGRKLFVGNLNFATTSDDLRTLFAEGGTCDSAMAWHIEAVQRPWAGEFLVSARNSR